jgi:glyoxylase-like metal-dependent hydrolase (beta-lactamase superfamily II)
MHVDHSGLISRLKRDENTVYASETDRVYIDAFQSASHWKWLTQTNIWCGVPEEHALKPEEHVAHSNRPASVVPIETVRPGDSLTYGDYTLSVVDLAGHTPGQVGLWHAPTGSLFSGDHILNRISPNITTWDLEHDYLGIFCENLKRVRAMPVRHLYPAHGTPLTDVNGRIDELLAHHAARLALMEGLVKAAGRPVSAFYVAKDVEWSKGDKFTDISIMKPFLASLFFTRQNNINPHLWRGQNKSKWMYGGTERLRRRHFLQSHLEAQQLNAFDRPPENVLLVEVVEVVGS